MLLVERRELRDRFRAGDRAALGEVYRHYAPELAAFLGRGFVFQSQGRALRFAGYREPFDLDNALAETFLRAFKESARLGYDGLHPFSGYLVGIARNLVLDELRRREVAMSALVRELPATGDGPPGRALGEGGEGPGDAEEDFLKGELLRLYHRFVGELDEREGRFFRARFEEQATQVVAGGELGLSHMQARWLEKKLRQRFLKFMQRHGYLAGYRAATLPMLPILGG